MQIQLESHIHCTSSSGNPWAHLRW